MILLDVPRKSALYSSVENKVLEIANIATIMGVEIILLLEITQFGKRVNDDSENNIQTNDIYNNLECGIMDEFEEILLCFIIKMDWFGDITDSTTIT